MNLWNLFPASLLEINGILNLPYFVVPVYAYIFYLLFKHPQFRVQLSAFLSFSTLTSFFMFINLGPRIGNVIAPLVLIFMVFIPLGILIFQLFKKNHSGQYVWFIASLAGLLHSISWVVWLFVLMQS